LSKLLIRERNSLRDFDPTETCKHMDLHEIGCDFDKDGMLLRLIRCQKCGLLMREYLPTV